LATDPDNQSDVVNPDDRDSDDHVGSKDMLLGTASGGPSGQVGNHAVTQVITQDTASGNNAVIQNATSGGLNGQAGSHVVFQRDDAVVSQL
jgi:hypothetical protein